MSANKPRSRRSRMCSSVSTYASAGNAPMTSRPSSAPSSFSSAPVMKGFCTGKAISLHEDGGPEVLRYEDVADPEPAPGEVLVSLRAAGLNHLDIWVRKGLPSVPKPRILGAHRAGLVVALGDDVESFAVGDRVVINPGIPHGDRITVIGEHTDGTCCELKSIPASQLYPLDDTLSFVHGAASPLTFETAYRMLVTKAAVREGEWVLIW